MTRADFDSLTIGKRIGSPLGNVYQVSRIEGVGRHRTVRLTGPDFLTADARKLSGDKWVVLPDEDDLSAWPTDDLPEVIPAGTTQ